MIRWIALFGISLLAFTAFLDVTIVNTALPFIKDQFKATVLELQWVTNIYSMVLTMSMVIIGRLADLYGRKKVFFIGVVIFGIAALGAGFSPNIEVLIFFRALLGLGASVLFVASASLISDAFPVKDHAKAIGIYSAVTGLGLAIGPLIGGLLLEWLDWRWAFWINVPIIIIGFFCTIYTLKIPTHVKAKISIDWKGFIWLTIGFTAFVFGIVSIADLGFNSLWTWATLITGGISLFLFVREEKASKAPLLDFTLYNNKLIKLSTLSCSLAGIASFVFMFFDPLYLNIFRHFSALKMGLLIAAIPAAQVVISIFFNRLLKSLGIKVLMIISILAAFLAIIGHFMIGEKTHINLILIPFVLLGINWGLSNAGTLVAVNQVVPKKKIGSAIGSIFMTWNMVGSIFLALSSAIFHAKVQDSFLSAFHAMVAFNAIFALLVVVMTALLSNTNHIGYRFE